MSHSVSSPVPIPKKFPIDFKVFPKKGFPPGIIVDLLEILVVVWVVLVGVTVG